MLTHMDMTVYLSKHFLYNSIARNPPQQFQFAGEKDLVFLWFVIFLNLAQTILLFGQIVLMSCVHRTIL